MNLNTHHNLRRAIFVSFADIFMGATGLILALIVLASSADDPRSRRVAEITASCLGDSDNWQIVDTKSSTPLSIDGWVARLGKLPDTLLRVGLRVEPIQMSCFDAAQKTIQAHNRALASRGAVAAPISLIWLPHFPDAEDVE